MDCNSHNTVENDPDLDGQTNKELMHQIVVLQDAVTEMKSAFSKAIEQLGSIQYADDTLQQQVEKNKTESHDQIAEVVKLILALQAEFGSVKCQLQQVQDNQSRFQQQFQDLLISQDYLLEELHKTASISDQFRHQYNCSRQLKCSVGSQSNDSGVALLLERAQSGFSHAGFPTASDHDSASIPETSPILISPMVHDYVAGLGHPAWMIYDAEADMSNYDSDSSLLAAANKSLRLSTSLGKQCGLQLQQSGLIDDEDEILEQRSYMEEKENPIQILKPDVLATSSTVPEKAFSHNLQRQKNRLHKNLVQNQDTEYRETQRLQMTKSILEAEKKYCRKLWILQDSFMEPLKRNGIICAKDFNTLFPEEIFKLYEKHCTLMHKIEERIQDWKWHRMVGDIFIKFINIEESNVLHLYTSYVNEFPEVLKTFYKQSRNSDRFTKFLKDRLRHPSCFDSDLIDFLLTPVQRLPTYVIHLKQLLKLTCFKHPDYENLTSCLNRLRDFLVRLNDSMEHSFQLIMAQAGLKSEHNHCIGSSLQRQGVLVRKQNRQKEDSFETTSCISSDNESTTADDLIQPQIKTYRNVSKENVSEDRSQYSKYKMNNMKNQGSQEALITSKVINKELGSVANQQKILFHSPLSLQNYPRSTKSVPLSTALSFEGPDISSRRIDSCGLKSKTRIANEHSNLHSDDSQELEDDDSIFNDKYSATPHSESPVEQPKSYAVDVSTTAKFSLPKMNEVRMDEFHDSARNPDLISSESSKSPNSMSSSVSKNSEDKQLNLNTSLERVPSTGFLSTNDDNVNKFGNKKMLMAGSSSSTCSDIGVRTARISEVHHTSSVDLISSLQPNPVRPLVKAHSSHAVHQSWKDQNTIRISESCKSGAIGDQEKKKTKSKYDKKKVSLRSLKSIFSRKRYVNHDFKIDHCTSCQNSIKNTSSERNISVIIIIPWETSV